ncbi:MAG TPA: cupin domain-containing protein [Kofleriaceae bacterium]|nr:cupin domain-containing protein [Kofleriaceae bacterium]
MTRTTIYRGCAAIALVAGSFAAGDAIAKARAKPLELSALKDVTWTPVMKDSPLPASAPIHGDSAKGAYEGYLKLPAGFESPPHKHSHDYWAVLIQGRMTHWAVDGGSESTAKQLGFGDLAYVPADLEHISKCYPGQDCIVIMVQPGKFDFVPTKPAR